ncbi:MAG: cysteine desulfurase [Bacteriovoracaceae bacterium]|jgi:cysteine desulfurase
MLYFDHAASTPLCPEALETLQETMKEDYANPSAAHKWGKELNQKTQKIREEIKAILKASKDSRLVFTGSASESNNSLIKGLGLVSGDKLLVSLGDHASLVNPSLSLKESGIEIGELPLNSVGVPEASSITDEMMEGVKLVLISSVNSQSGGLLCVEEFAKEFKGRFSKVHLHVDAVQSFAKFPLDLSSGDIDSVSLSAHKMGGPKGVAALWVKKSLSLTPLLHGGNQESNFRSSTIAYPLIASFYRAVEIALKERSESLEKVTRLRDQLIRGIKEIDSSIEFPFDLEKCSPYITSLLWNGISSDIVLRALEEKDVAVASTSACSSKIKGENPTMKALGLPVSKHKFVLRLSLGKTTSAKEIEEFLSIFKEVHSELKMFVSR